MREQFPVLQLTHFRDLFLEIFFVLKLILVDFENTFLCYNSYTYTEADSSLLFVKNEPR